MSDPEHLRRLNALLEEALALPVPQRADWLAARPEAEHDFVPELRRLLARAAVETDTFMRHPAAAALDELAAAEGRPDAAGDLIGPWRLLQALGEGGMATVWLAERADGQLARQVALKLPRHAWSAGLGQRMARERNLLAALEHPNIARLYDAGVTEAGRPWLAMERVTGIAIDEHCTRQGLGVPARLRLLLQVCDALAHAHARLIVHRDLKPANILVTGEGEVRLLDFGVGKLLHDEGTADASLTQLLGNALTPDYASPEQVAGKPVTVATDVYSLGVVLYELLAGQRPYRLGRQSTAALEEAILAADVARASSRTADRARARALRGDLDAVLAKALAKNPARRYASIEALASDLRAHLQGLPVAAQPPSRTYRGVKFLRRHRAGTAMASLLTLALVVGLAGTLTQALRAEQQARLAEAERDRALEELRFADAADELMRFAFSEGAKQPFTTQQLLERAEQQVERGFADVPALRARLQLLVAEQHREVAAMADAERVVRRARESAEAARDPPLLLQADCMLAATLVFRGERAQAREVTDRARRSMEVPRPHDQRARLNCHANLAIIELLQGDPKRALVEAEAGLALIGSPPQPGLQERVELELRAWAGEARGRLGDGAATVAAYDQVLLRLRAMGRANTTWADAMFNNAGNWHVRTGHPLRALAAFEHVLGNEARRDRPRDPVTLMNHARALSRVGRHAEAKATLEQALPLIRAQGNVTAVAYAKIALATAQCGLGPLPLCEARLAEAEADMRRFIPAGRVATAVPPFTRAQAHWAAGNAAAAESGLQHALGIFEAAKERDPTQARALALWAQVQQQLGQADAARATAQRAVSSARAFARGIGQADYLGLALAAQGEVLAAQGRMSDARTALDEAVAQLEGTLGPDAPALRQARAALERLPFERQAPASAGTPMAPRKPAR